jgi:carbon monoxide dehydrogenase subunit G
MTPTWSTTALSLAAALAVATAGQLLPHEFEVARTRTFDAPPEAVVALVSDLDHPVALLGWRELGDLGDLEVGEVRRGVGAWAEGTHDGAPVRVEVQLVEPGRRVMMARVRASREGGSAHTWPDARSEVRVEPHGEGSSVTWRVQGSEAAPILGPYVALLHTWTGGRALHEALDSLGVALPDRSARDTLGAHPVATTLAPRP